MSLSLVKKSLQLLESSEFKGTKKNNQSKSDSNTSKKVAERVRLQSQINKHNAKNIKFLKTFEKLQKHLKENTKQDRTKDNLERLQALGETCKIDNTSALKFFKRATNNKEVKIEESEQVQSSMFTEEDFANFEKEYAFD